MLCHADCHNWFDTYRYSDADSISFRLIDTISDADTNYEPQSVNLALTVAHSVAQPV